MNTKNIATNYQMQEWMDIIRDCRNSGLIVQQYRDERIFPGRRIIIG